MRKLGVAFFTGMEQTAEQNVEYLSLAANQGYRYLFTSLHIPEADCRSLVADCRKVLTVAKQLGFTVTADISPRTWDLLSLKPQELGEWGIDTLRIDYGFSPEQICRLSRDSGLQIELNASAMTEEELAKILATGMERRKLCAGHNYYPRPETGLGFDLFIHRSRQFQRVEIPVSVFVPGQLHPRGPIRAGLPTLETHRRLGAVAAVRQLWATGLVDTILFSDPLVPAADLAAVAALPHNMPDPMRLRIETFKMTATERRIVELPCHTNRNDAAGALVRSQESRESVDAPILPRSDLRIRHRGDVTIDNSRYGRYAGELQIVLHDLPADEKVNVVGKIAATDLCLLDCIFPGRAFTFEEVR